MSTNKVETLLKREAERQHEIVRKKNEQKLTTAENEKYTYFSSVFEEKSKEIQYMLDESPNLSKDQLNIQLDKMYKELNLLKKFISDSIIFLRNYDIRIYHSQLQELESKIKKTEEYLQPKKKFGFKTKKASKEKIPETDSAHNLNTTEVLSEDTVDNIELRHPKVFENNFFGFKNLSKKNLTLNHDDLTSKDVTLHNLSDCVIHLPGTSSTLQLSSLNNCTILCGPVTTSIFAESCFDCRLIFACQQLRLHSSINCTIYLHVTSKAIIEDCSDIKVAPYNYFYDGFRDDFKLAGLDMDINNWDKLDDFNWLVADKASPNWCVLEKGDRVADWDHYFMRYDK